MKLIIGLGNPGTKYQLTRHNVGFMAIDGLAQAFSADAFKAEHKAHTTKIRIQSEVVLLAKPQTFMNLSGESVQALMSYYGVEKPDILVAHDEIEIPFATLRYQVNRGHGGHNGIRSIHQHLGGNDYKRLRLGVGRPSHPGMDVADYVLQNFNKDEMSSLPDFLSLVGESLEHFVTNGFEKTATRYNRDPERK